MFYSAPDSYEYPLVYVHYKYFYSYSAGIDFSRQNLTSTGVRLWRLKSYPRAIRVNNGKKFKLS